MNKKTVELIKRTAAASPDLLKDRQFNSENPIAGHCYITCEALKFLEPSLKPNVIRHEGGTHWFLTDAIGNVIDPTAEQFRTPIPYEQGRGSGFLTKLPSRRAMELLRRAKLIS